MLYGRVVSGVDDWLSVEKDILVGGGLSPPLFQPLDEANDVLQVVQESVRNFDTESYHRGQIIRFALFLYGSGGGLMSSVIFTIPPNLPLEREACGKALPCIASQYKRLLQSHR